MGSPCSLIAFGEFVKNWTVSVQFSYVGLYVPLRYRQ